MFRNAEKRGYVYLAYVDDSGSDKTNSVVVIGAVVVRDTDFFKLDTRLGAIAEVLVPENKRDKFEEFHASELFGGYGVFEGVSEEDRHNVLRAVMSGISKFGIQFIYAAVDKKLLDASPFGSSNPLDVAFRVCVAGIADYVVEQAGGGADPESEDRFSVAQRLTENPFLLIADDTDEKTKHLLRTSFRSLRPPSHKTTDSMPCKLWMCHDDMFFGDSKFSIGIQLADICTHVMLRYFRDGIKDRFFDALLPTARAAKPDPLWEQCAAFMKTHDDAVVLKTLADLARVLPTDQAPLAISEQSEPASGQS